MDDYTRALFGQHAAHVGFNYIAQDGQDGRLILVAQTQAGAPHPLLFGSKRTHTFAMGDVIFRPRLVLGSDDFRGSGMTHLMCHGFNLDKWLTADIVLDPSGEVEKAAKSRRG